MVSPVSSRTSTSARKGHTTAVQTLPARTHPGPSSARASAARVPGDAPGRTTGHSFSCQGRSCPTSAATGVTYPRFR
eukprot:3732563-Rhodomonas_salina.1